MMARKDLSAMLLWALALGTVGCRNDADSQNVAAARSATAASASQFQGYWNQGKGEVTRYALEQARYGEIRKGDAVLIFVTEDFIADKQVKLESDPVGKPVAGVLKLNMTKKFNTGIYPYSMMTSIFTPVDLSRYPHALKVTTTSQEWCGHTFTQFNLRGGSYNVQEYSYFEKEGDQQFTLDAALLEDEVWARIRIAPESLPTGEIRIVPGTMTARLRHIRAAVENATASRTVLAADSSGSGRTRYTIEYKGDSERKLAIDFESSFPHRILEWTETYKDGFGPKARMLTTRAVRTNELMIDYWTKNSSADDSLRTLLGLE